MEVGVNNIYIHHPVLFDIITGNLRVHAPRALHSPESNIYSSIFGQYKRFLTVESPISAGQINTSGNEV